MPLFDFLCLDCSQLIEILVSRPMTRPNAPSAAAGI